MKIKWILFAMLFSMAGIAFSQAVFYNSGRIRYQRKVNSYRLSEGSWMNRFFEKEKFSTDTLTLDFDSAQSLYYDARFDPESEQEEGYFSLSLVPSRASVAYKNHQSDSVKILRDLFEEKIFISDSIRKPKWKITGEVREIAGFNCQKAVTVLFDSVYVVAFFTDQITTQSGPEGFGNLPGMIMGMAIPRLYITWMAIDFQPVKPPIKIPSFPKKKKEMYNWQSLHTKLAERFSQWGPPFKDLMLWMWGI